MLERQPANVPALYKPVSANGRETAEKKAAWEKRTVIDCRRWSCALPHRSGESSAEPTFLESFSAAKLSWKLSKVPRDRKDRQGKIDSDEQHLWPLRLNNGCRLQSALVPHDLKVYVCVFRWVSKYQTPVFAWVKTKPVHPDGQQHTHRQTSNTNTSCARTAETSKGQLQLGKFTVPVIGWIIYTRTN